MITRYHPPPPLLPSSPLTPLTPPPPIMAIVVGDSAVFVRYLLRNPLAITRFVKLNKPFAVVLFKQHPRLFNLWVENRPTDALGLGFAVPCPPPRLRATRVVDNYLPTEDLGSIGHGILRSGLGMATPCPPPSFN